MGHWANDALFYHIYPLGFCGVPFHNDLQAAPVPRLEKIYGWLDHLEQLGVNALYLGPLFESSKHGYDTADYYHVDRRLGSNETLARLSNALHARGIRLILDGVFNHVGRDFWAFRDVRAQLQRSRYTSWFQGLSFNGRSPCNDPFVYEAWNGHYELVKLNLHHPEVKDHIFQAVAAWIRDFDIDGLRLDVADCLEPHFIQELAAFCRTLRPDFWLLGEVIHGDYCSYTKPGLLDSVTNYEAYKGLYSSHVDRNYHEIAYTLNRQFGDGGLYRELPLYSFADNHDVNRVASTLHNQAHLYPLYCLLFTMPGVPSIYYGSEWGIEGRRSHESDHRLRPCLDLAQVAQQSAQRDLAKAIGRLAHIRRGSLALKQGRYCQLAVSAEQLAFLRHWQEERAIVLVNASDQPVTMQLNVPLAEGSYLQDRLNPGEHFTVHGGKLETTVMPCWSRILIG
jgi:cyclomaltodextrinase / maltogenic alpha-amylase / neopullulanase